MSLQGVAQSLRRQIPNTHRIISPSRSRCVAVQITQGPHDAPVAWQFIDLFQFKVPKPNNAVIAACGQRASIRSEPDYSGIGYWLGVQHVTRGRISQLDPGRKTWLLKSLVCRRYDRAVR